MKRRWLFWLLIVAFIWIIVTRFAEIEGLAKTLAQGQWEWILAAAGLQVGYYVMTAATFQSAFDTLEVDSRIHDLIPLTLSSLFVNVVAPSAGASGAALFVDDAARRDQSPTRTAIGALLQLVSYFTSFSLVLLIGMAVLFLQYDVKVYELIGATLMLLITAGWSMILMLGLFRPTDLQRLLEWTEKTLNKLAKRLHRHPFLAEDWAEQMTEEFRIAALAIAKYPMKLARTLSIALAAHMIDIASLYTLFLAFNQPIQYGPLVAGYAMGITFLVISPTPQGIGFVEGIMTLVYSSIGIPGSVAATVSLAFRGLTFWLPLALGATLLRRTRTFRTGLRILTKNPVPDSQPPDPPGQPPGNV
jgi:uncharacterized protein (TIRG00374 family)